MSQKKDKQDRKNTPSFKEIGIQDRLDALLTGLGINPIELASAPPEVFQNIGKRLVEQSAIHIKNTGRMAFLNANTRVEKTPEGKLRYKTSILATPAEDLGEVIPSLHVVVDSFIENIKEKAIETGERPNLSLLDGGKNTH